MSDPAVFISYSRKDEQKARFIADGLQQAGLPVWMDVQSIRGHESWLQALQRAVEDCGALVVVMTRAARASEWVERETLLALQLRKPIFVALMDDVPLPLHLIDRQYTDLQADPAAGLSRLTAELRAVSLHETAAHQHLQPLPEGISAEPTADNFFAYVDQMSAEESLGLIARDIYRWALRHVDAVGFGGKHTPGLHARLQLGPSSLTLFSIWAYRRRPALQLPFDAIRSHEPYTSRELRLSTLRSLNRLLPDDAVLDDDRADRRPALPLDCLDSADKLESLQRILSELVDNLQGA